MKLSRLFAAACAASALTFAACDDNKGGSSSSGGGGAVSEKDALADFKKGALEVDAMMGEMKAADNPATGMPKLKAAVEKMKALKTDGLPADLKDSFTAVRTGTLEMLEVFKDMPEKPEEAMAFLGKLMSDPALGEKMMKLKETGKAAGEKFKAAAAKHGIELQHVGD